MCNGRRRRRRRRSTGGEGGATQPVGSMTPKVHMSMKKGRLPRTAL